MAKEQFQRTKTARQTSARIGHIDHGQVHVNCCNRAYTGRQRPRYAYLLWPISPKAAPSRDETKTVTNRRPPTSEYQSDKRHYAPYRLSPGHADFVKNMINWRCPKWMAPFSSSMPPKAPCLKPASTSSSLARSASLPSSFSLNKSRSRRWTPNLLDPRRNGRSAILLNKYQFPRATKTTPVIRGSRQEGHGQRSRRTEVHPSNCSMLVDEFHSAAPHAKSINPS